LADLINLGSTGIQIDDKLFFDFSYVGSGFGGAVAIPASGIAVTPIDTPLNPGLQFNAPWSVGPGQGLDSFISYSVRVLEGGAAIEDVSATMAGVVAQDGGFVSVAENVSLAGTVIATLGLHANGGLVNSASATFDPTLGILEVVKDIAVNGNAGFAAVSQVTNQFSEVPVPPTALLLGSGLLGLVGLRFRRKLS
jgi:hypothetical protein